MVHRRRRTLIHAFGPKIVFKLLEDVDSLLDEECRYHVEEKPEEYVVYVEMPGVDKKDIEAYANPNSIYVSAKPSKELPWGNREYRVKVRFRSEINPEDVKAKYENGILTLHVPKKVKGKRISIE